MLLTVRKCPEGRGTIPSRKLNQNMLQLQAAEISSKSDFLYLSFRDRLITGLPALLIFSSLHISNVSLDLLPRGSKSQCHRAQRHNGAHFYGPLTEGKQRTPSSFLQRNSSLAGASLTGKLHKNKNKCQPVNVVNPPPPFFSCWISGFAWIFPMNRYLVAMDRLLRQRLLYYQSDLDRIRFSHKGWNYPVHICARKARTMWRFWRLQRVMTNTTIHFLSTPS